MNPTRRARPRCGLIVQAIAQATYEEFQIGVQLMRNALKASLAVAKVAGGTYIRAGAVVGMTTSPRMVWSKPFPLDVMEYRSKINAWDVKSHRRSGFDALWKWFGEPKSTADVARAAKQVGRISARWATPMSV